MTAEIVDRPAVDRPAAMRVAGGRWAGLSGLALILATGLALRVMSLVGHGFRSDVGALTRWAEAVAQHGLRHYYATGGTANYPPLLYVLYPIGRIAVHVPTAIRAISIPFDLLIGVLLYLVLRRRSPSTGLWAAGLYLFNPAVLAAGPLWGQVDSLGAIALLGGLIATASRRYGLAGALGAFALLAKPQFGIGLAVLAAVIVFDRRAVVRSAGRATLGAMATAAAILLPLGLSPVVYVDLVERVVAWRAVGSISALNMWAIPGGFNQPEGPAFAIGTGLFVVAVVLLLLQLRRRRDLEAILAVAALIAMALYFLPTRIHERYLFGAIVLLAPLAATYPPLRWPYVSLSVVFALDLAYLILWSGGFPPTLQGVELPLDVVRIGSVAMMAAGTWCAWHLARMLGRDAPQPGRLEVPGGGPSAASREPS